MTTAWSAAAALTNLGVVLLFLGGGAGCTRSPQETRDRYLERGKRSMTAKDYSRALVEFRNAAQAMPNDAEAHYQIGVASLGSGDMRNAVVGFRTAVELDPKHAAARLRLSQMMASSGDPALLKDAESRLNALMEASPVTHEMLNTLAFTKLKLGRVTEAAQALEQVLADMPQALDSSAMLARARLAQKDVKGAEEVLKKACDAAPGSADPRVILGRFYRAQKQWEQAEAEFRHALRLNSKSAAALMDLASLENALGRTQEAEADFKRLAGLGERAYKPAYSLFLFQQRRHDEAIREIETLAREEPDDRQVRTWLVSAYRAANRTEDAEKLLEKALEKDPKDVEALLHRAELYVAAGNSTLAEADTNLALQLKPDVPEVRYAVAKLYQMRNATPRYRQELGEVLRLNPFLLPVRVELAQALTASNQAKAALDILDATPDSQKTLTPVLVQRNWAYLALGHLPEMRRGIDLGLARGGRSTDLLVQDAVWKLRTGNSTGARVSLEEALKINPSDLRALTTLKDSYVAEKSPGIALQRIREHAARQPNSAPVQDFLGLLLLASGDRKQARAAFEAAKAADPGFARSDLSLAQLDAVEGKWNDAHSRLQALVSANAGNTTARLWLGNIEVLKGNHQAALDHFRRVVESDPGNAQALNNLAYALLEYANRPEEALEYARRAVERAQDQPAFADTLGWVLYRMGAYSTAVKHLERAALHKAGDVVSKYHLAMAYAKMGDLKRSRSTLAAALKINPRLPEAQMAQELLSNGG